MCSSDLNPPGSTYGDGAVCAFDGADGGVRVSIDERVSTVGIFASGRMAANPGFLAKIKGNE